MSAPKQKSGKTTTVRPASTSNPGDSAQRHKNRKGSQSVSSAQRDGGRFSKGSNPGVSVGNSGNGRSNAAMNGFPHRAVPGSHGGRENITAEP